jgi:acyl-CoA dehydrogenase
MDFQLPEDVLMLRRVVREFVERELIPIEAHSHRDGSISGEVLRPLQDTVKAMGLWLLDVPEEFGGIGLTQELPLEYWYRELRSLRISVGTPEVLRWRLARNLMRARGR